MANKKKKEAVHEIIDTFHHHGVLTPMRTIYSGSYWEDENGECGIDFASTEQMIKNVIAIESLFGEGLIRIIMNSPGGSWYHGMACYDFLKSRTSSILIECYGHCMSMATILLQAADTRLASRNCRFMLHYGSDGYIGNALDFEKAGEESKVVGKKMIEIYLDRMRGAGWTEAKLRNFLKVDQYKSAEWALEQGLIDAIID